MDKPYDLKGLVSELKGKGLDLAEDAAKHTVESVFTWLEKSAELSTNPFDNVLAALIPAVKIEVFKAVDRIDGELGA